MTRNLPFFIIVIIFLFSFATAGAEEIKTLIKYDKDSGRLTVRADNISLKKALTEVARLSGVNIMLDPATEKKVRINIRGLPLDKGIKRMLRGLSHSMIYEEQGKNKKVILTTVTILPDGKTGNPEPLVKAEIVPLSGSLGDSLVQNKNRLFEDIERPNKLPKDRAAYLDKANKERKTAKMARPEAHWLADDAISRGDISPKELRRRSKEHFEKIKKWQYESEKGTPD